MTPNRQYVVTDPSGLFMWSRGQACAALIPVSTQQSAGRDGVAMRTGGGGRSVPTRSCLFPPALPHCDLPSATNQDGCPPGHVPLDLICRRRSSKPQQNTTIHQQIETAASLETTAHQSLPRAMFLDHRLCNNPLSAGTRHSHPPTADA